MKLAFLTFLALVSWTSISFADKSFVCKNDNFSDLAITLNLGADIANLKVVAGPEVGESAVLRIDEESSQADWLIYRFEAQSGPRAYEFSVLKQDLRQKSFRLALRASDLQRKNVYTSYDMTCVLVAR